MKPKYRVVVGTQVLRKRLSDNDLVEHPANRGATRISALNAKANPPGEHVHHHHHPMASQEERFAADQIDAPQAVLQMPDKAQPGWAIISRSGSIVFRQHAADQVFVDVDVKGTRDLLGDAGTANTGIAAFEFDDRVDELLRWPLWAGAPMATRREKPSIFRLLSASWNLNRMTASLGSLLAGTNSDPRRKMKRSNEFKFGARLRARRLMTNWCFTNIDSATTARTPPGRMSLAMVAKTWTASMCRCIIGRNGSTISAHKPARAAPFLRGITNSPCTSFAAARDRGRSRSRPSRARPFVTCA